METRTRQNRGFALVEMLTSTVILVIFIFGLSTLLVHLGAQKEAVSGLINRDLDQQLAEKVVFQDMLHASPSFNNILLSDDTGRQFFEYFPDRSPMSYRDVTSRRLTLRLGGRDAAYFIVTESSAGSPLIFDPTVAYETARSPNPAVAGVLQYASLNKSNYVASLRPGLWREKNILMLDTPARLRPPMSPGAAPRSSIFLAQIIGTGLKPLNLNFLRREHPAQPTLTVDSPDVFFRTAPAMNGSAPIIRLKAVQVVRYILKPSQQPGVADAYRETFDDGAFTHSQLFARNVESLVFERASVFQPLIGFKINQKGGKAPPLRITPASSLDMNNFVIAGTSARSTQAPLLITIHNSCFDTSFHPVANPVLPTSTIEASFELTTGGTVGVSYPAKVTLKNPLNGKDIEPVKVTAGPGGTRAYALRDLVRIEVPAPQYPFDPLRPAEAVPKLTGKYQFIQRAGAPLAGYSATTGPVGTNVRIYQLPGSYSVDVTAAFPGHGTFCGGVR